MFGESTYKFQGQHEHTLEEHAACCLTNVAYDTGVHGALGYSLKCELARELANPLGSERVSGLKGAGRIASVQTINVR